MRLTPLPLYIAALFIFNLYAQHFKTVVGTVESVSGDVVTILSGKDTLLLAVDAKTAIWKGKMFHDLSMIRRGDTIIARYAVEPAGKLLAEEMWLNIVNFYGDITRLTASGFEVWTNPNADPQSAYKKEVRTVNVDADTKFEASASEDLRPGRSVQVIGVDLGAGTVGATKVTVYEGNRPVRMSDGQPIAPPTSPQ